MGGKSYFCDYCHCFMKNDVNVRKTHNDGLSHKIKKVRCMKKFEDPRTMYEEEVHKTRCSHYFKGFCRFDLYCQSSHYDENQLKYLHKIAHNLSQKDMQRQTPTKESESVNHILPWKRNNTKKPKSTLKNLPPSLRPLNFKKLFKSQNTKTSWN